MISILDYGAGNLRSVCNALTEAGRDYRVVNTSAELREADAVILPGVGHFGQMMTALDALGVRDALLGRIGDNVPFLGICLGMQALFEGSEEAPGVKGLGLLPGIIRRFPRDARVPHMGWNEIEFAGGNRADPVGYRYFAHSYYAPIDEYITSETCTYGGVRFMAALQNANGIGVQYHPEKSGAAGLALLKGFAC
jgi:imidazole glycerol phosphate synthase glutamine amidotransferase subunit